MIELRPYQKRVLNDKAILDILMHIKDPERARPEILAPLVVSATGTGKTAMFCAVAEKLRSWGKRTLILVHRREILDQTVKSLYRMGVPCGQIVSGKPMTGDLIQVASVQTLVNRLDQIWRPDFIISDEAHHGQRENSWGKVIFYYGSVPRMGVTATPARLDGRGLRVCWDHIVYGMNPREATEEGYLTFPTVYTVPEELHETFHIVQGDFDTKEQEKVMSQKRIVGDVISHYRKRLDGAPTLVACNSLAEAELYADQFRQAGYRAREVDGEMSDSDRDDAIQGLANGKWQLLLFKDLIGEGVDIPVATGLIKLRKTMSLTLELQWDGRIGRPVYAPDRDLSTREGRLQAIAMSGKPRSIILDHAGNFALHGHPLADRQWSLDSPKRLKGELPPATTTCPKCYGVWPGRPRSCPACGHSFQAADLMKKQEELRIVEGDLVEAGLDQNDASDMAAFVARAMAAEQGMKAKMLMAKAFQIMEGKDDVETRRRKVEALAEVVGYKPGWTEKMWELKQKRRA